MEVINELKELDSLSGKWKVIGENRTDHAFETTISDDEWDCFGFEGAYIRNSRKGKDDCYFNALD